MEVKKQLIMEKALELFAENGINATSVQQITQSCGISKGAFYLAFTSKSELILALIDHFMGEVIADIEQSVNDNQADDRLLYNFYYTVFTSYQTHSNFTGMLLKEPMSNLTNEEIFELFMKYDVYTNEIMKSLIERQFPDMEEDRIPDIIYLLKGFVKHYSELFILSNYPVNLPLLCESLVEKTTVIAEHATIPFISSDYLSLSRYNQSVPSKEQLITYLTEKEKEITDPIIIESLQLLRNNLKDKDAKLSPAMTHGLIKNLRTDSHTKWLAYLYELYIGT